MSRLEEMIKIRVNAIAKGTAIEQVTEDDDVRQWLVLGRMAMFFCVWAVMIMSVALIVSLRF
ncbi:hypothetical protein V8J82_04765 [Gymnodinialimonas sp. 2305UL16-5]|uniref:hypothetical protein n=1 Tax=Gymnodinialimonas mytili TaxID=3126503 RepID=UPI0030B53EF6